MFQDFQIRQGQMKYKEVWGGVQSKANINDGNGYTEIRWKWKCTQ